MLLVFSSLFSLGRLCGLFHRLSVLFAFLGEALLLRRLWQRRFHVLSTVASLILLSVPTFLGYIGLLPSLSVAFEGLSGLTLDALRLFYTCSPLLAYSLLLRVR